MSDETTYIYIIAIFRDGEITAPVKVGISKNPVARLRELQTAAPYPLRLVRKFAVPDRSIAKWFEGCFHATQTPRQTHGEWFNIPPAEAQKIVLLHIRWGLGMNTDFTEEEIDDAMHLVETR